MDIFLNNKAVGYTKTGLRHRLRGEKSQDFFQYFEIDGFKMVCVCDGCSSAEFARLGAVAATFEAIRFTRTYPQLKDVFFDEAKASSFTTELLLAIRARIDSLSKSYCRATDAFASTILCAVLFEDRYLSVQLGDGAFVISHKGRMQVLPTKTPDVKKANVTYSTCDLFRNSWEDWITVTTGVFDHFFVMTDGVRPLYESVLETENLHAMTVANAFYSSADKLKMMNELIDACSSVTLDDATMFCVSNSFSVYDLNVSDRFRLLGFEDSKSKKKYRKRNLRRCSRFYQTLVEEKTVDELAKKLNVSPSMILRIGNRLEHVGLVRRIVGDRYIRTNQS